MLLAHVDVETTGTNPDLHDIWEVSVVLEEDDHLVSEYTAFVEPENLQLADSAALQIGGFYRRYPMDPDEVADRGDAAAMVAKLTADAVLVGAGVHFDAAFLTRFLKSNGLAAAWHYALVDVKALAAGVLGMRPPWSTDQLLRALDIDPERLGVDRHTARGDVEVSRAIYHMALIDRTEILTRQLPRPAVPPAVEQKGADS